MADETNNDVNLNDIIKEQQNTIKTLVDNIKSTETESTQQPIYQTTPQKTAKETPNYTLYIMIGIGLFLLLRRR